MCFISCYAMSRVTFNIFSLYNIEAKNKKKYSFSLTEKKKRNNLQYSTLFHFNRSRNKTNFARSGEIHFDAKRRTDPNFRINKIGFSIHHSGKKGISISRDAFACAIGADAYVIRKSRSCNVVPVPCGA